MKRAIVERTVLDRYWSFLRKGKGIFSHIRVCIKEDEDYGEGIVEMENGTPSSSYYDKEEKEWR